MQTSCPLPSSYREGRILRPGDYPPLADKMLLMKMGFSHVRCLICAYQFHLLHVRDSWQGFICLGCKKAMDAGMATR